MSSTTCPDTRARARCAIGNGAYNQKQHDVWGAVLDSVYLHAKSREQLPEGLWPIAEKHRSRRPSSTGGSRIAASGRCAASRSTSPPARSCAGSRSTAGRGWPDARRAGVRAAVAGDRRRDPRRHLRERRRRARRLRAALRRRRARRVAAARAAAALPAAGRPRMRATVLAIADELTEDGLVLRYRVEETDDGLPGEEGTFTICSFWLVSALVEIGEIERAQQPVRAAAVATRARSAVRRGDRPRDRPAPRQLPAGVHPPGTDQRRHAPDPRGGRGRQLRCVPAGQRADLAQFETVALVAFVESA